MSKPTREQAEKAVKTLIEWAGDDPTREGLIETPKRVVKAYEQFFEGYHLDPEEILRKTFEEVEGYDEMVIVKDIRLERAADNAPPANARRASGGRSASRSRASPGCW